MGKKITSFLVFAAMLFALPMNAQSVKAVKSTKGVRPAIYVPKTVKKPLTVIEKKEASEPTMLLTAVEKAQAEKEAYVTKMTEQTIGHKLVKETRNRLDLSVKNNPLKKNVIRRAGEVVDANGIITSPAEGTEIHYTRSGVGLSWNDGTSSYDQVEASGDLLMVECEDGTVYIKDVISQFKPGTYVKGTKEGNTITIPTGQVIYFNSNYSLSYFLAWGDTDGAGDYTYDSTADAITFTIDGDVISLNGSSIDRVIAPFYTYQGNTYCASAEFNTVWTLNEEWEPLVINEELVTLPAGVEAEQWFATGADNEGATFNRSAQVAFDGTDVYVSGLFSNFPNAFIKGTLDGTKVTFKGLQFIGTYSSTYNMYAVGVNSNNDLDNFTMTYDEEAQTLTSDMGIVANAATDRLYYLEWIDNVTLNGGPYEEPTIVTGDPVEVPYTNDFADDAAFAQFGVYDANMDANTWALYSGAARYLYSSTNNADDWLVSPPIKLLAGQKYRFAIDTWAQSATYAERVEVLMGTEAKASAFTTQVIEPTDVNYASTAPKTLENANVEVEEDGYYYFAVHAISDADKWALFVDNFVVEAGAGANAPAAVSGLAATPYDETIGATITFTAPTMTVGGTELAGSAMTIELQRDGTVINTFEGVTPGQELTYEDADETLTVGNHTYTVIPSNEEGAGEKAEITVFLSKTLTVPFTIDMTAQESFAGFNVVDNNADGTTWKWGDSYNCIMYGYNYNNAADDYLISSPIRMEAGKNYKVVIVASCYGENYPERFEVLLGSEATVAGLTTTVIEPTDVATNVDTEYEAEFTAPGDGKFYLAIHAISDANQWNLYIKSFAVELGLLDTDIDAVTDFTVTPGEQGALSATVSFTAPTKNIGGADLTENIAAIEILRDGETIQTFNDVAPGTDVTFNDADEALTNGNHTYQVIPYNAEGKPGRKSEKITVFLGVDAPQPVPSLATIDGGDYIVFSWEPVSEEGVNGGFVNTEKVGYSIWTMALFDFMGWFTYWDVDEQLDSVVGKTKTVVDFDTEAGDVQELKPFAIIPATEAGEAEYTTTQMFVGPAYDGLEEHFAGGKIAYNTWTFSTTDTDSEDTGAYFNEDSSDGDGYSILLFVENAGNTLDLTPGKVKIPEGATNPVLLFDYQNPDAANSLQVNIEMPDGSVDEIALNGSGDGWQPAKINLMKYASQRYIIIRFVGNFVNAGNIVLDNILVYDQLEYNLVADITAPKSLVLGKEAPVKISLRNMGANAADGYTVKLFANDEEIEMADAEFATIESLANAEFDATFPTTVFDEAGTVTLRAEVEYDLDLDEDDNVAETTIEVTAPTVTAPLTLTATANGTKADLEWTVAEGEGTESFTEGFDDQETYPEFETGGLDADVHTGTIGEWTVYDGNGGKFGYGINGIDVPNLGGQNAWIVMNPTSSQLSQDLSSNYAANSPEQYMISVCVAEPEGAPDATDKWLISPELPGVAQTISFQQRIMVDTYGAETFEVLASSTDKEIASFTKVADFTKSNTSWEEVTVDLPEGTKYFAIRHTSTDIWGLMIDDVTFLVSGSSEATAFNIYVDEILVGSVEGDVLTFTTDVLPAGEHKVSVTALYGELESLPVDATVNIEVATAIEDVINADKLGNIFHVNGVKVRSNAETTKDLQKGAYIINNKKVVVK